MDPRGKQTIILLNEHSNKMTPKDTLLYPSISASEKLLVVDGINRETHSSLKGFAAQP